MLAYIAFFFFFLMAETSLGVLFLPAFCPYIPDILIHKLKGVYVDIWTLPCTSWARDSQHLCPFLQRAPPEQARLRGRAPLRSPHTLPAHPGGRFHTDCSIPCPRGFLPPGPPPFPVGAWDRAASAGWHQMKLLLAIEWKENLNTSENFSQ